MPKDPIRNAGERLIRRSAVISVPSSNYRATDRLMADEQAKAALMAARHEMTLRSASSLIESINSAEYKAISGPLSNSLEWQEICRRARDDKTQTATTS